MKHVIYCPLSYLSVPHGYVLVASCSYCTLLVYIMYLEPPLPKLYLLMTTIVPLMLLMFFAGTGTRPKHVQLGPSAYRYNYYLIGIILLLIKYIGKYVINKRMIHVIFQLAILFLNMEVVIVMIVPILFMIVHICFLFLLWQFNVMVRSLLPSRKQLVHVQVC